MDKVFGKYRIAAPIALESPNAAYHGRSITGFEWDTVIKVYATRPLHSQEDEEAFLEHMAALSKLEHPHILPIIDYGIEKKIPFCVTEYMPHGSLRDYLEHRLSKQLSMQEMITIIAQIGRALQYAHEHHNIHGNIKPENILFNKHNDVLLTDFYLPEKIGGNTYGGPSTIQSIYYQAFEDLNEKSDQYALGYLADELFSELMPVANTMLVSPPEQYIEKDTTLRPSFEVSKQIRTNLLKAMAREPDERYENIAAFIEALNEVYAVQSLLTLSAITTLPLPVPIRNMLHNAKAIQNRPIFTGLKKPREQNKKGSARGPLFIALALLLFGILSVGLIWQFSLTQLLQKNTSSIAVLTSSGTVTIATPPGMAQLEPTLVVTPTIPRTALPSTTATSKVRISPTATSVTASPTTVPTAVATTPAIIPTPTTAVPTAAPILTLSCHVDYEISNWDSGFQVNMTITNTSTLPINGWSLQWTFVSWQKITEVWNANIFQSGSNVTLSNAPWNASIPPGTSTNRIGFSGTYNGQLSNPAGFILNGTVCN